MTTDAPRPESDATGDAPAEDAPSPQSDGNAVTQVESPTEASPTTASSTTATSTTGAPGADLTDPLQEPESSSSPEPPETADAPESVTGDTQPAAPEETQVEAAPAAPTPVASPAVTPEPESATPEPVPGETAPVVSEATEPSAQESGESEESQSPKIQMQRAGDAAPVPSTGDTTPAPSNEKVEIPSADDVLDKGLEAELEAALAGESAPAPPAPPADGEVPAADQTSDELSPGQKITGTISSIAGDNIVIDLGVRTAGILPARQMSKQEPAVGQTVNVVVDSINEEEGTAAVSLPGGSRKPSGNWDAVAVGQVVDAVVKKTNKGGLEVMVGGLRGFMPASQVDLGFVSDLDQFVGQKLPAKILEVNPQRRKLVVSRRALIAEERKEKEGELFETLQKGKTVTGRVKSIKDFGAFVDLGGADGLLHIGQISWSRINHPSDVLSEGQEVEVQILDVDSEKKKISLSMRQLQANPWTLAEQNYPVGSPVTGTVSRVADFGAFVKLEPGVEGLIHISQLDHKRVRAVGDVVREGQEVEAKVLEVDTGRRRISLSLKAMTAPVDDPAMMDAPPPQEDDRRRRRKNRGDLRGGTGGSGRGGLFGDPSDFN